VLQARGVAVGPEDGDGRVARQAEGLEPFVGLLAVVEGRRHAVDAHVGVGDELEGRPFARFDRVVGFDVAVDWGRFMLVSWARDNCWSFRCSHPRGHGSRHWTSQWC
jgi:hypothetical protein